jgi:hypothetical protein
LEQLAQACEPAFFENDQGNVVDETYHKAGMMDSERFSLMLDPVHTNLIKIVRGYLLEGTRSKIYKDRAAQAIRLQYAFKLLFISIQCHVAAQVNSHPQSLFSILSRTKR